MNGIKRHTKGFTIVELLIVIVVIGILAAVTVVAYNGLQQKARDSDRLQDILVLKKALEMYKVDNGGYPHCNNGTTHVAGGGGSGGSVVECLASALVPKYIAALPLDPINSTSTGTYVYNYAVGYRKTGPATYVFDQTSNYVIGGRLETVSSPTFGGWSYTDLTLLEGS